MCLSTRKEYLKNTRNATNAQSFFAHFFALGRKVLKRATQHAGL
jgi:hypothetical protein